MKSYLEITPEQWSHIKETYPKEDVKVELAKCAMTYEIPYVPITETEAYNEYMKLKGTRWPELLKEGEWFPRRSDTFNYHTNYYDKQMYFSRSNVGNAASNYFQQANRWSISGSQGPGPVRTWGNLKYMTSLMGAMYSLKMERIDINSIRTGLSLRKYTASQFKPNVAKAMYDYFKSEVILDFSMGWGDRLAGFYASDFGKKYIGLDPRKENHPIYRQQEEFYKKHNGFFEHDRETEFHCEPAEDFDFSPYENSVDLIFTSPPYFNVEKYSDDNTQSWVRYKEIDDWNENFLHKALGKMIPTLKNGGRMAINISDVYGTSGKERKYLSIVNPMNDFLKSKGLKYEGCIGMAMAKRPNSGGAGMARENELNNWSEESLAAAEETKDMRFGEPIWLWKKQ